MKEKLVKSVLNKKKKRDDWFLDDYTLNPYEGCSFNCQYCFIRGSKYGENMAETLSVKMNGPTILDKQLASRARKDQYGIIALASATDPYIKAERNYRITRQYLEIISKHCFPVLIITKSTLVQRDFDVLKEIDERAIHAADLRQRLTRGTIVSFSFSTLDDDVAATLEPGAPPPSERLRMLTLCKQHGLMAGVNLIPVLPYINDQPHQLDDMIRTFAAAGAQYVLAGGLTLFGSAPADSRTLYYTFLARKFPQLQHSYDGLYGANFYPPRSYQSALSKNAVALCVKYGIRSRIA